jgi:murein endopeptidase
MSPAFCAEWNPDFAFYGSQCCGRVIMRKRGWSLKCTPSRSKMSFCDEMTEEQKRYLEVMAEPGAPDVLQTLSDDWIFAPAQAFCSPHNGFLAWGRPLIPSEKNKIALRRPDRCVHFGTNQMVGMLEWVGRKVAERYAGEDYQGVHLLVGDISAPRGGCLAGKGGRRGHLSHTSGQDVDVGFLEVKPGKRSPASFVQSFDAPTNWWLLKQVFNNPYACVQAIFLDRRMIKSLSREALGEPDWERVRGRIKHVKYHRNHFHVRIAETPRGPDCFKSEAAEDLTIED